jgi:hypothetical protein
LDLIVHPEHSNKINQSMIDYALNHIKENAKFDLNVITIIRKSDENKLNQLKKSGFSIFETSHILGLKMDKNSFKS